ncbi:hypothetical protein ACFQES_05020 [Nonomuraea salmonea]|uniref:hypothetical protein n=1 Tax=Nonomuraea salmonea TaxID=46181 RepID=UPI003610BA2E
MSRGRHQSLDGGQCLLLGLHEVRGHTLGRRPGPVVQVGGESGDPGLLGVLPGRPAPSKGDGQADGSLARRGVTEHAGPLGVGQRSCEVAQLFRGDRPQVVRRPQLDVVAQVGQGADGRTEAVAGPVVRA